MSGALLLRDTTSPDLWLRSSSSLLWVSNNGWSISTSRPLMPMPWFSLCLGLFTLNRLFLPLVRSIRESKTEKHLAEMTLPIVCWNDFKQSTQNDNHQKKDKKQKSRLASQTFNCWKLAAAWLSLDWSLPLNSLPMIKRLCQRWPPIWSLKSFAKDWAISICKQFSKTFQCLARRLSAH